MLSDESSCNLQCLKPNPVRHGHPTAVTLFFARVSPEALNPIQLTLPLSYNLPCFLRSCVFCFVSTLN
ncbi:hypothetical protein VNO77_01953 [Canavalia gladiata]|uniref:Uncharacterized protein n=1 Tax=Canavalia gladiata TaxID=3824 RepID=A0AAN9MU33_CANGL